MTTHRVPVSLAVALLPALLAACEPAPAPAAGALAADTQAAGARRAATRAPQPSADEPAVVAVVQRFFDAMHHRDVDAFAATMLPDAAIHAAPMRPGGDPAAVRGRGAADDIEWLRTTDDTILERMWDYEVRVHGRIATLWTPYDLWINGEFSHCGVDAFTLVRVGDEWKISAAAYTVEPEGCASSPLGPPTAEQLRGPA